MKTPTVAELRKQGYTVKVSHKRNTQLKSGASRSAPTPHDFEVSPRGGITKVEIVAPDQRLFIGEARCSDLDNYNKSIGRNIAIGRALKGGYAGFKQETTESSWLNINE